MAALHPQIVHFAIVFILLGVVFRFLSLFGRPAWVGPAAATLLILAAPIVVRRGALRHRGARAGGTRARRARGSGAHEGWGDHVPFAAGVLGAPGAGGPRVPEIAESEGHPASPPRPPE